MGSPRKPLLQRNASKTLLRYEAEQCLRVVSRESLRQHVDSLCYQLPASVLRKNLVFLLTDEVHFAGLKKASSSLGDGRPTETTTFFELALPCRG